MLRFLFKACKKCRGDLALDDGDWICLQCGTYYYVGLYQEAQKLRPPPGKETEQVKTSEKMLLDFPRNHVSPLSFSLATVLLAQGLSSK